MSTSAAQEHKVVSQKEWLEARKAFLAKEKNLTRQRDALNAERLELPWVKVDKNYVFDGPNGKLSLSDLFGGRSQLIVYHFMFGPGWKEGCPSCSMLGDGMDGAVTHLANRDVTLVAISRAPIADIQAFQKRMNWGFKWYSSFGNDFNFDYNVSFTKEEVAKQQMYYNYTVQHFPSEEGPGASVFYKDAAGSIFHTYSTFGRGLEGGIMAYNYLDIAPKGRNEADLPHPMAWVRHHDRYEDTYFEVVPAGSSAAAGSTASAGGAKSAGSCCGTDHHS